MPHDPTKILLGSTASSDRVVSAENADPASFPAGLAVRRSNAGALGVTSTTGRLIGVSLGRSLSDHKKTAVCRDGNLVPIRLTDEGDYSTLTVAELTFTAKAKGVAGDDITIALVDDGSAGTETVDVDGTDIVVHMEDGASTAQQIVDAIEASEDASALIGVTIESGEEATAQAAAAEDNLAGGIDSYPYVVIGDVVLTDNTTGLAASSGTTTGAKYASEYLSGIDPITGEEASKCALIDMGGGL